MSTRYPFGYGRGTKTMDELHDRYSGHAHPEFWRRLAAFLESRNGEMGIGSLYRVTPSNVSAASRAGHSFHQSQRFASGLVKSSAADLVCRNGSNVHRAPHWSEVPRQGTNHP